MATEYTRKERETINRAWSYLIYMADSTSSDKYKILRAEKYERAQRSCLMAARALILEAVFNLDSQGNVRKADPTAAELSHWSEGLAVCACIGAGWRETGEKFVRTHYADGLRNAVEAVQVHDKALHRALDAINARIDSAA